MAFPGWRRINFPFEGLASVAEGKGAMVVSAAELARDWESLLVEDP